MELLGEVVVDGGGAVAVDGLNLTNRGNGNGLVAAQSDQAVHIGYGQLIEEGIPLGVVVIHAHHVLQLQAVLGTGVGATSSALLKSSGFQLELL